MGISNGVSKPGAIQFSTSKTMDSTTRPLPSWLKW